MASSGCQGRSGTARQTPAHRSPSGRIAVEGPRFHRIEVGAGHFGGMVAQDVCQHRRRFKQYHVHVGEGAHAPLMPAGEFGAAREPVPPEVHLRSPAVDQEASRGGKRALCQRGSLGFGWRGILERKQVDLPRNGINRQVRVQESRQRVVGPPGRRPGLNERTGANHGDLPRGFELVDGARGRAPVGVVVPRPRLAPLSQKEKAPRGRIRPRSAATGRRG